MSIFTRHFSKTKHIKETIGICEACGNPIWKANSYLEGERYVELMPDYLVHVDCMPIWIRENEKEAK